MDQASMQHFQNGNRLFSEGKYQQSKKEYQKVLKQNPQVGEVHYNLALTLDTLGQQSRAAEEYQKAIRCNYQNATVYYKVVNPK